MIEHSPKILASEEKATTRLCTIRSGKFSVAETFTEFANTEQQDTLV